MPFLSHMGCSTLFPCLSRFGVLVPTLFPFCSHSCPTLYLVPASFPLCSTLFLILSRFGVLIFALFPLCLIFVPLVLGPTSFPVSILVFLWGSCFLCFRSLCVPTTSSLALAPNPAARRVTSMLIIVIFLRFFSLGSNTRSSF